MKRKFRDLLRTQRWLKMIPNSLTLCNSLCGFAAILWTLRAYEQGEDAMTVFSISAFVICFAMVFDALDGFAARIFNAASMHGIQMDSLADMVTFGVAPATLVAIMTHSLRDWELRTAQEAYVYILSSVYLGGAALRLATYNVHAMLEKKSSDTFSGLPSPGAAAAICVTVVFAQNCSWDLYRLAFWLPVYAALLGVLMVTPIPYVHAAKWLLSVRRNRRRALLLAGMLLAVAVFRISALAVLVTLYVFSGPVIGIWQKFRGSGAPAAANGERS